jgi:hypothetical protein
VIKLPLYKIEFHEGTYDDIIKAIVSAPNESRVMELLRAGDHNGGDIPGGKFTITKIEIRPWRVICCDTQWG